MKSLDARASPFLIYKTHSQVLRILRYLRAVFSSVTVLQPIWMLCPGQFVQLSQPDSPTPEPPANRESISQQSLVQDARRC